MFKLSSDVLANFRGVQSALRELLDKIADIYRRLRSVEERIDGIPLGSSNSGVTLPIDAVDVDYDNSTSGLTATDVQDAIDELAASSSGYTPKSFIDLGYSSGSTTLVISNNTKTGENTGAVNSAQIISHQFFGGGGKFYFEVFVDNDESSLGVGVVDRFRLLGNVNHMLGNYVGKEINSFGYWHNGTKYNNNTGTGGYSTFTDNDVIGVAVDTTNGYIWFAKNNTWIEGDPAAGTTPSYTSNYLKSHLHIYVTPYATNAKATIRGLSSEFTYSAPTGFSAAFD